MYAPVLPTALESRSTHFSPSSDLASSDMKGPPTPADSAFWTPFEVEYVIGDN